MDKNQALYAFEEFLLKNYCSFDKDLSLKYNTYFKMGGLVKFFLKPQSIKELVLLRSYLEQHGIEYKTIGFTTNTFFLEQVEYTVLISTKGLTKLNIEGNVMHVESGYSLQDMVRVAVINQAKEFEGLEGIPASIGGALFMNAGAYGSSISDNLIEVECLNEQNKIVRLDKKTCDFSYRNSIFKSNKYIILSARFLLKKGNPKAIAKKIERYHIARHSYQEFVYPTLGSMISMRADTYLNIMRKNKFYVFRFWCLKLAYKNPLVKLILRKRPHRDMFNKLLFKYLTQNKGINLKYKFSNKNVNILKNDGSLSSKELIEYIFLIHSLVEQKYHIENEIIIEPIFKIDSNFQSDFNEIVKLINKIK